MATATLNVTDSGSITITLTSVTDGSTATSSAVDNSTNKYLSALIQVKVKTASASTSATGSCSVYLIRSADGGTTYDSTGRFLGAIGTVANSTTYTETFSTEPLGALGSHWKLAVVNNSGATLDGTIGSAAFAGVKFDIA